MPCEISKISKAHISVVGKPSTTILYHIIIRGTLNIFLKTLLILQKKTPKYHGSQNFGYQIWFCTRLLCCWLIVVDSILVKDPYFSLMISFFIKIQIWWKLCFAVVPLNRLHIATKFCTCHNSTAVVSCAKFCSYCCIRSWMIAM